MNLRKLRDDFECNPYYSQMSNMVLTVMQPYCKGNDFRCLNSYLDSTLKSFDDPNTFTSVFQRSVEDPQSLLEEARRHSGH